MPSNLQLDSKVNHNSHPIDLNRYSSSPLKRPRWYQIKLFIFGKKDVWCISTVSFIMVLNSSVNKIDIYNLVKIRSKYIQKAPNRRIMIFFKSIHLIKLFTLSTSYKLYKKAVVGSLPEEKVCNLFNYFFALLNFFEKLSEF